MTDPNDITQASAVVDSAGGPGGLLGAVLGALTVLGGLFRILFGTRKERTDATERAAEIALRAAEHADERAERADEETASHKMALGTCEEQLRAMREQAARERAEDRARIGRLEKGLAEHASCGPRIEALESDVALSKRMLADYMRTGSTPPPSQMPSPDEVRAGTLGQATQHAWEE